jgi:hypothetical protein
MGKHEAPPPFKMILENGRLVPAAAWDQERLSTYRNRSVLTVRITQEKSRPLERKYWAILNRVVKDCPVKWRTTEDAHKAIKLALGVVEPFLTVSGKMHCEIKSTSDMEEPEYREFFDDAMALLHRLTGVDPLTLHAESADVGEDDPDNSQQEVQNAREGFDPSHVARETGTRADDPEIEQDKEPSAAPAPESADGNGSGEASPSSPAADQSESRTPAGETIQSAQGGAMEPAAATGQPPVAAGSHQSANDRREMIGKFLDIAALNDEAQVRVDIMKDVLPDWRDKIGDEGFVKTVYQRAVSVVKGELPATTARDYLERIA